MRRGCFFYHDTGVGGGDSFASYVFQFHVDPPTSFLFREVFKEECDCG